VVSVIASETDRDALLVRVLGTIVTTANADLGLLAVLDGKGTVRIRAIKQTTGPAELVDQSIAEIPASVRRAIENVLLTGVAIRASATAGAAEVERAEAEPRAVLCVPMERNGVVMGAVYLENRASRHAFNRGREGFVQAFANQAAIALENARLLVEVQSALELQTLQTEASHRFVPEHMMRALSVSNITDVALNQASESEMTVVFADLRGFTSIASQLGPKRTVEMINRYLDHVQPGIAANGGFVVQYFGDGLIALFPARADDALFGAIAMVRGLAGYNQQRGDFPELQSGIGIHHGPVVLGVIGDPDHIQCAVIGDAINVASRIEAQNKEFHTSVLISEDCLARLERPDLFELRPLGPVRLRGKAEPLRLFELAGETRAKPAEEE
jgi:class 3 adenylate cyclase